MKNKCVALLCVLCMFPLSAQAAVFLGLGGGFGSAEGKNTKHTYSKFTPISIFMSIVGDTNFAFDFGYSQLADIEEKEDDGTSTEVSLTGIFFAGRYIAQYSDIGYAYTKLGIYRWDGTARKNGGGSSGTELSQLDNTIAEATGAGFTHFYGLGTDFVYDGGLAFRIEYEHLDEIGNGLFDNNPKSGDSLLTEGYGYDRFLFGLIIDF